MPAAHQFPPLHAIHAGQGDPALLFVHGFPLDHRQWQPQLDHFQSNHAILLPDLRGLGQSPIAPGQTAVTMQDHAADLAALLDQKHISQPIVLIGLSMGGYIAWEFVRKYPERLRALVLCHTRVVADTPEQSTGRLNLAAQTVQEQSSQAIEKAFMPRLLPPSAPVAVVKAVQTMARTASPAGLAANLRGMAVRADATAILPTLRVPTLVLSGELDAISPPAEMQEWTRRIPGARFHVFPGIGHLSPLEAPAAFNQCLSEFLRDTLGR